MEKEKNERKKPRLEFEGIVTRDRNFFNMASKIEGRYPRDRFKEIEIDDESNWYNNDIKIKMRPQTLLKAGFRKFNKVKIIIEKIED